MRRFVWVLASLAIAASSAFAADTKPLIDISGGKVTALRTAFNDNPRDVRVVVILSPS